MGNINLLENYKKEEAEKNNPKSSRRQKLISTGLIMSLVIVFATFLVWGGVILWNNNLNSKISVMDEQLQRDETEMRGNDASRVLDINQRLDEIKNNLNQKKDATETLKKIESLIMRGIVAKTVKLEGSSVVINLSADNFGNLSKQIFNFKKDSSGMKNIAVSDVKRGQKGAIDFVVKAEIGK
jgi:hypothetical protein